MIAKLTGRIEALEADRCVVDVRGVGYLVQASTRTLAALPGGALATLLIETQVREDAIALYGFSEPSERDWFRLLTTVQGVGAKLALAVLGVLGPDDLARAIAAADKAGLGRAPGVGPKLAGRIAAELKDKVGGIALGAAAELPERGAEADAVSALVNLGYRRAEAFEAVAAATRRLGGGAAVDALIRAGLKELSQ